VLSTLRGMGLLVAVGYFVWTTLFSQVQPSPIASGQACHPSYARACLHPAAPDYDCAGGDGDGPYYTGRVIVVEPDVFDLDSDNDGVGCE
jgi:hypothetical protein